MVIAASTWMEQDDSRLAELSAIFNFRSERVSRGFRDPLADHDLG